MEIAFTGTADVGGINSEQGRDLHISKGKHKIFVEVNEEGTEAAAVTSVLSRNAPTPSAARFPAGWARRS